MGNYQESAAVAHAVSALGPGWNWETMSALYPSVEVYTEQYRKLGEFHEDSSEDAGARFLLAYTLSYRRSSGCGQAGSLKPW